MESVTDYRFQIDDQVCVVRNVPCYDHHGFISFNMDAVGQLAAIRDRMRREEIPYDVDFAVVTGKR